MRPSRTSTVRRRRSTHTVDLRRRPVDVLDGRIFQIHGVARELPGPARTVLEDHGVLPPADQPAQDRMTGVRETLALAERQLPNGTDLHNMRAVKSVDATLWNLLLRVRER